MSKRPAPNFGSVFRRDLDEAKSGYMALGGSGDGSSAVGIDYDQELRHDIKAASVRHRSRNGVEAERKRRIRYPTTRFGRAVHGINKEISETTKSSKSVSDVSGW